MSDFPHEINSILNRTLGTPRNQKVSEGQFSYDCPNCLDGVGKGNLEVNVYKDIYSCWACRDQVDGLKGRDIRWLVKRYGTLEDFKSYCELKPTEYKAIEPKVYSEVVLPKEFLLISDENKNERGYNEALGYLNERGVSKEIIEKHGIGFCSKGKFYGRIIVPSYNVSEKIDYFVGRDFTGGNKYKYLNADNEKTSIIFNENLVNWDLSVFLVEGVFDHIVTFNSIPILGKTMPSKLASMIQKRLKGNLYILLDSDAIKVAKELKAQLDFGDIKGKVLIIQLPDGEDPSTWYKKCGSCKYYKSLKGYIYG